MIRCLGGISCWAVDTWQLAKERGIIVVSMKICVFFCIVAIALGVLFLVLSSISDWPYANLAFSMGFLWLAAGLLISFLVFEDLGLTKKIKKGEGK
jgi:hypothetical protein